ncbi:MAG: MoaD/ThiS family protein [Candidatus Omnitrophica bacterium]|nr:MoaD/ThiS family protein [Candidatus Omnitrophota bacterium]
MVVRLLCFAQLKDRLGKSEFSLVLPNSATGRGLFAKLTEQDPGLGGLLSISRLAVNCEYASLDQVLQEGDEVAIILPVSGG